VAKRSFPDPVALVAAERTPRALWRALEGAPRGARVVELRLDYLGTVAAIVRFLERLGRRRPKRTLIATCRRQGEGGEFTGSPAAELAVLNLAARAGCGWVDI